MSTTPHPEGTPPPQPPLRPRRLLPERSTTIRLRRPPAEDFGGDCSSRFSCWLVGGSFFLNLVLLAVSGSLLGDGTPRVQEKFVSHDKNAEDKVVILPIEGIILESEDGFVKRAIDTAMKDEHVKAVVLRVDSPGGSVSGSDYLYHHLCKLAETKKIPIVVSMGSIAASGGYYVSMAVGHEPDTIFAEPTCFTGFDRRDHPALQRGGVHGGARPGRRFDRQPRAEENGQHHQADDSRREGDLPGPGQRRLRAVQESRPLGPQRVREEPEEAGRPGYRPNLHMGRVWRNTTERNEYITGGIGPSAHNEGFTVDYDLPNLTAYQETCATVALAQWAHRLALLYGDARYADVLERGLYNGVLSGVSQDGTKFFYVNPLESAGTHHRSPWFGCACCPPNVTRTLAALGGYAYAVSADSLYVNLYIQGSAQAKVGDTPVTLKVKTDYPWEGKVALELAPAAKAKFALRLRVPGWCHSTSVAVNHRPVKEPAIERGCLVLDREWKKGDHVELDLAMPVERVAANPRVKADQGLLAIQRGPIVYCLEQCDQSEPLSALWLPPEAPLKAAREPGLLGGVVTITGEASLAPDQNWRRTLYQPAATADRVAIKAIPYYAWDNRKPGTMKVWLPVAPPVALTRGLEAQAKVTVSFANDNCQPQGINDGVEPKSSGEQPSALCHWWPHKGTEEWAQYTWKKPVQVCGARAYWFDDTGRGECRLPASWRIEYRDGGDWKAVTTTENYPVAKDQWCAVRFAPVKTTALRLVVQLPPNFATGIHEWKVDEVEENSRKG